MKLLLHTITMKYPPPSSIKKIPSPLFDIIHRIHDIAVHEQSIRKTTVLSHLTNLYEAYQYVYYVYMVHQFLQGQKGKIVDWGGFIGQVTILLRSLGYDCENNVLSLPSAHDAFTSFAIPYIINTNNPKVLPYKDNSVFAVISSGVLEHVYEHDMTDREALHEIYRVLQPKGYFFCWNLPKKYALLELLALWHNTSCHPIRYKQTQIKKLLEDSKFDVKDIGSNSGILTVRGLRTILQQFDPWKQFVLDYYASQIPGFHCFAHHITVVAQKR